MQTTNFCVSPLYVRVASHSINVVKLLTGMQRVFFNVLQVATV